MHNNFVTTRGRERSSKMGEHGMRRAFTADVPYHVPYLISNYWVRKYGWENFHPALAQLFSPALHKSRLADFAILFCVPGIDEAVGSSSTTAQQLPLWPMDACATFGRATPH